MGWKNGPARSQVGIGTLIVFISMVIVAMLAGGILLETTGLLQAESDKTGKASSQQVTDRVEVRYATATYSGGSMDSIEIDVTKAPGSGDVDVSKLVIHWLGSGGSTEITASTFSVSAKRGSASVLEDDSDLLTITNLGQTIPDGERAAVRLVTAEGGVTSVVLRAPSAPPSDAAVSLLQATVGGNPGQGATPTPTPSSPTLTQEWVYDSDTVNAVAAESGTSLYAVVDPGGTGKQIKRIDPSDASVLSTSTSTSTWGSLLRIDANDDPVWWDGSGSVYRWDTSDDSISSVFSPSNSDVNDLRTDSGNVYLAHGSSGGLRKYDGSGSTLWTGASEDATAVDADSNAVYVFNGTTFSRHDHDGTSNWTDTVLLFSNPSRDIAVGPSSWIYALNSGGSIRKLAQSDGSVGSIASSSSSEANMDLETGADGYLFATDGTDMVVLDSNGNTHVTKSYGGAVDDIEVRSDGVYVEANGKLFKYSKSGF